MGEDPASHRALERARRRLDWVDDDDLDELEARSKLGATLLGFFTWGGGRIYVGDRSRGFGLVVLMLIWVGLTGVVPEAIGSLGFLAGGLAAGLWSHQGARAVNRYLSVRTQAQLERGAGAGAYRLLRAAAEVDRSLAAALPAAALPPAPASPGPHAALIDELRKVAALRRAGVLHEAEAQERRIDLLTAAAPAQRSALDDLLLALVPLRDEGTLSDDDLEFVKQIGGTG